MAAHDARGMAQGSGSAEAIAACEQALWRLMSFYDVPMADLDVAIAADPRWAWPFFAVAVLLAGRQPARRGVASLMRWATSKATTRYAPSRHC